MVGVCMVEGEARGRGKGATYASVGVLIYGFVTITMCLHGAQQQVRRVRDPCAKCT